MPARLMRTLPFLLLATASCGKTNTAPLVDACILEQQGLECPECADGDVTCSLDGVEASAMSCGGCQARAALTIALCEANSDATRAEIEGATCVLTQAVP